MSKTALNLLKGLFLGISLLMMGLTVVVSLKSNLWEVLPELNKQPWFTATIVDFYFNIILISAWAIYREGNWLKSALWIVGFVVLGSIATAFYVFLQLSRIKPGEGLAKALLKKSS